MEFKQLQPGRENDFREAVLEGARHKAKKIIDTANKAREATLRDAYLQCEKSNYDQLKADHARDTRRKLSAVSQAARAELLQYRTQLVDTVFADAEAALAAFVASKDYAPWLAALAAKHKDAAGAQALITLRPQDMAHAALLQKELPQATVEADPSIELGGLRLAAGHLLFDETLDEALAQQKRAFVFTKELQL